MKLTREEMCDKMVELLEATESIGDSVVFNDKAVGLVKVIAEWARGTNFYKANREAAAKFFDSSATPSDIWVFILQKVIEAPTTLHRDCVVAAHMPALEDAIMREAHRC